MTKKTLNNPVTLGNKAGLLANRLKKFVPDAITAGEFTKGYKYIDLIDPKTRNPALALQYLFGARGIVRGRLTNMIAKGSCGKSSFMYFVYACAQLMEGGAWCAHAETEGAPAPADFIASYGADPDDLLIGDPRSFDDMTSWVDTLEAQVRGEWGGGVSDKTGKSVKSKFTDPVDPNCDHPLVIGIDSISVLGKDSEVMVDVADTSKDRRIAGLAKSAREYFGARLKRFNLRDTSMFVASQETKDIRTDMFSPKGSDVTCKAYEALFIHSTYVLLMSTRKWCDKEAPYTQWGDIITLYTDKNKVSARHKKIDLYLKHNHGFDMVATDLNWLRTHNASPFRDPNLTDKYGEIRMHGGRYKCEYIHPEYFPDAESFLSALYSNEEAMRNIREDLRLRGYGFDFETKYSTDIDSDFNEEKEIPEK